MPPLLLLGTVVLWLEGSSCTWHHTSRHGSVVPPFVFRIATTILVGIPIASIQQSVHILSWLINGFILVDLEFQRGNFLNNRDMSMNALSWLLGAVVLYVILSVVEAAVLLWTHLVAKHDVANSSLSVPRLIVFHSDDSQLSCVQFQSPQANTNKREIAFKPLVNVVNFDDHTVHSVSTSNDQGESHIKSDVQKKF